MMQIPGNVASAATAAVPVQPQIQQGYYVRAFLLICFIERFKQLFNFLLFIVVSSNGRLHDASSVAIVTEFLPSRPR